jgi:glycosyltransferase involved in cell wall biosynthesis
MPVIDTLVILTPGFPKDDNDTGSLPSQQLLVKALNQNFPQLKIIILAFQYPFRSDTYRWMNNEVIPFNGKNRGGIFRLYVWVRVWQKLKKIKKEDPKTGLLSFWYSESAFIGKKFSSKYGLKHFIWISGQDAKKDNRYAKRTVPLENEMIAMSDFLVREFYYNHHVMPAHIIPNAIDESLFPPLPAKREIDILGVGSLIPLKQYHIFLETVHAVKTKIPSVKAVLCGDGPEKAKLITKIKELGIEENVELTGGKSHPEVLELMQHAKLFLHPSCYEGLSTACLEALYAGAHVVSFVRSMAKPISKWHIVKTRPEMKEKALKILRDPQTGYERVPTFSMKETAIKIMNLYEDKSTGDPDINRQE